MTYLQHLRLGTRGSALALKQANNVKVMMDAMFSVNVELTIIKTTGDDTSEDISSLGGKGVFVKEIENALLRRDIDLAVHSFKDITSTPHSELKYSAFLLKERVTDAFVLFNHQQLPTDDCVLATGSMRRQALCQALYPNVRCVPIRGNIDTRIQKARAMGVDGVILSTAGLQRLGLDHLITHEPDPKQFVPAPGQGMLAIQHRSKDTIVEAMVKQLIHPKVHELGESYYNLLHGISFNCELPFGAYIEDKQCHVFLKHASNEYLRFPVSEMANGINQILGLVR